MMRSRGALSPFTRDLIDRERGIPPLPAPVRERAVSRARAALQAGDSLVARAPRGRSRFHWAAAVVLSAASAAVGAVGGAAMYEVSAGRAPGPGVVTGQASPRVDARAGGAAGGRSLAGAAGPVPTSGSAPPLGTTPEAQQRTIAAARASTLRAELRLLTQAAAAVQRSDFGAALGLIGQHARRFRNGALCEEREALRVSALVGLGRIEEARSAAATFHARFPRSVLLSVLGGSVSP